jgi:hypothetical protein
MQKIDSNQVDIEDAVLISPQFPDVIPANTLEGTGAGIQKGGS